MPPAAASRARCWVKRVPARELLWQLSLLLLVVVSAARPAQAALSPLIPYTTLGPGVVSEGGVAALLANYNASYVPYNASYPTVALGLSLPLVANSVVEGAAPFLAFMVDLTNFRGGVSVLGEQHYLSVTYTTDGNSPELCAIVYDDLIQSGDFTMLFAPAGDALLQAVSPMLNGSGVTLFSGVNSNPVDFADEYPNIFSIINTADATFIAAMDQINTAAQAWAAQGGKGSAYGITTVCFFTEQETLLLDAAKGVRSWIQTENARRAGHDPIVTVVDTAWNMSATMSYLDYAAVLPLCPDGTDVMMLQGAIDSGTAVAEALASSQLRPKAVIGLNPLIQLDQIDAAQLLKAAGWILPQAVTPAPYASLASLGGVFDNVYDAIFAYQYWQVGAGLSEAVASTYSYAAMWNVMSAALARTSNLTAQALREAVLALNNQTSLGGVVLFSNLTGVNLGPGGTALQVSLSGVLAPYGTYAVSYPVDWPWRLPTAGDALSLTQTVSPLLIALVVTALGTWVAEIIVEQAIFTRRQGSRLWWAWLAAVAGSLGGASVWCSMVMQSSAINTTLPGQSDPLPIRWSLRVLLLALLPALLLTFGGLLLHMSAIAIEDDDTGRSQLSIAAHGLRLKRREQMKQAALSHRQHLFHLLRAVTWRSVSGGALIAGAVVVTRATLWSVWEQDARSAPLPTAWVGSFVVDLLFIPVSTHMFFHALRWRIPAVFLFTAAVMNDWQFSLNSLQFTYAPGGYSSIIPASPSLTSAAVLILSGVLAAFVSFLFVGLQFSAMKLSRNDLTVLVISLTALVSRLRARVAEDTRLLAQHRRGANVLAAALNAVTLISALPQEYAVPLFLHSGVSQLPTGPCQADRKSITISDVRPTAARSVDTADESQGETLADPGAELRKLRGRSSSVAPEPTSSDMDADTGASVRASLVSRVSSSQIPSATDTRFTEAVQASLELQANHSQHRLPPLKRAGSTSGRTAAQEAEDAAFLLTAPLVAASAGQADKAAAVPPLPSLEDVMEHPVAVELFKQQLQKTQSVESLVFCLHVRCYRALSSPTARKLLALRIADAFIRPQSECQINISTRQSGAILSALDVRGESGCTLTLLDDAERECLMLIRTNAWKAFTATSSYRLCAWLCHQIDVSDAVHELTAERSSQPADLPGDLSWLSQSGAGTQDRAI